MANFVVHFKDGTFTEVNALDIVHAVSDLNQRGQRYNIALIYEKSEIQKVIEIGLSLNDQRRRHAESVR